MPGLCLRPALSCNTVLQLTQVHTAKGAHSTFRLLSVYRIRLSLRVNTTHKTGQCYFQEENWGKKYVWSWKANPSVFVFNSFVRNNKSLKMSLPLSLIILPAYKKMSFYWSVVVEDQSRPCCGLRKGRSCSGPRACFSSQSCGLMMTKVHGLCIDKQTHTENPVTKGNSGESQNLWVRYLALFGLGLQWN